MSCSHLFVCKAPSNIAFIKYWGKTEERTQWPANDSLSMTLSKCYTETKVKVLPESNRSHLIFMSDFLLSPEDLRSKKIIQFLSLLQERFGFENYLEIKTRNYFPTACGIASSASGFAALTISAIAAWTYSSTFEELDKNGFSKMHLSHLARLGSGSACRSLWGGYVNWIRGICPEEQRTLPFLNESHWSLKDVVVILDSHVKSTSSSDGHKQAFSSPLFEIRESSLLERLPKMKEAIKNRDFKVLGPLLEEEALEMHSVMLSQNPILNYLLPETKKFITWLRKIRIGYGLSTYFTLDAGPNPHLICEEETLFNLLKHLKQDYPNVDFIVDGVGAGPTLEVIK